MTSTVNFMNDATMMTDSKLKILLNLGEVGISDEWIDYLSYGFDSTNVPALLEIIASDVLSSTDEDSKEFWAPLHAWRALGQLSCAESAKPLVRLFDQYYGSDWAAIELPKVLGMIGEPSIEPLNLYLNQPGPDEFARAMASDGLKEIGLRYPQLRATVVEVLTNYLKMPDTNEVILNACVVASLIDLSATESIDTIRDIYAKDLAELAHCGDIEEVEMALGLRDQRSTPKPNYFKDSPIGQLTQQKDDDPSSIIDACLMKYGTDESILDESELDGFLSAVVCAPTLIKPSTWLPAIWGGFEDSPEWEGMDEVEQFTSSVMAHYNETLGLFRENQFSAIFLERKTEKKTYTIVDEWCEGFVRGLQLWPRLDQEDQAFLDEHLKVIRPFTVDDGPDPLKEMSDLEIEGMQQSIEPSVQALYDHFVTAGQTYQRKTPKVGRNDPCPCGSGKKYKKCCLH